MTPLSIYNYYQFLLRLGDNYPVERTPPAPGDQAIIPNLRSLLTGDFSDLPMRSKPCFHNLVGSSFASKTSHPLRRYASFGDATQDATVPPWQILIEGMVEAPKVVVMPSGLPRQLTAGFVLFPLLRVDPHRSEMNS